MKFALYIIGIVLLIASPVWSGGNREKQSEPGPREDRQIETAEVESEQTDSVQADSVQTGEAAQAEDGTAEVPMDPIQEQLYSLGFQIPKEPFEAPDFTLSTLEGKEAALSDYDGDIIFLNFWATWCPPCRQEMPSMQTLYEQMGGRPFTMLAVNLQEEKETVEQFITENGYTFPVLLDTSAQVGGAMYGVQSIPTTYIISKEGEILARLVGTREWDTEQIVSIFKEML
jgi:peroxiredoxin